MSVRLSMWVTSESLDEVSVGGATGTLMLAAVGNTARRQIKRSPQWFDRCRRAS